MFLPVSCSHTVFLYALVHAPIQEALEPFPMQAGVFSISSALCCKKTVRVGPSQEIWPVVNVPICLKLRIFVATDH